MARRTGLARELRLTQTAPEEMLWSHLRGRRLGGFKLRRQAPIGRYVVDFICVEAKLIIEVDGPSHQNQTAADAARTALFDAMGYLVLRFGNDDVLSNIDSVLAQIFHTLELRGAQEL